MKKKAKIILISISSFFIIVLTIGLSLLAPRTYSLPIPPEIPDGAYRIMTYNLRYASSDNAWEGRREGIRNLILDYHPDSIGMQEADWDWMFNFLQSALVNYSYVGVGRDDGVNNGESTPIFYLKDKFNLLDNGTFWLSETPDEPSKGWDAHQYRICTYAVLENNETGEIFTHFNTHLDVLGFQSRIKGSELILSRMSEYDYPGILTGDFNSPEGFRVYKLITNSFLDDTKRLADITMSWGTFNAFTNFHFRFIPPIDYIFVEDSSFDVHRYEVLYQHKYDGKPMSDHFPVFSDISLLDD